MYTHYEYCTLCVNKKEGRYCVYIIKAMKHKKSKFILTDCMYDEVLRISYRATRKGSKKKTNKQEKKKKKKKNADIPDGELTKRKIEVHVLSQSPVDTHTHTHTPTSHNTSHSSTHARSWSGLSLVCLCLCDDVCDVCVVPPQHPSRSPQASAAQLITRRALNTAPAGHSAKPLPTPHTPTALPPLCPALYGFVFFPSYNCCAPPCAVWFPFTPFLGEVEMDEMTFCTLFS